MERNNLEDIEIDTALIVQLEKELREHKEDEFFLQVYKEIKSELKNNYFDRSENCNCV